MNGTLRKAGSFFHEYVLNFYWVPSSLEYLFGEGMSLWTLRSKAVYLHLPFSFTLFEELY